MLKKLLIIFALLFACVTFSQDSPWFLYSSYFQKWAQKNHIRSIQYDEPYDKDTPQYLAILERQNESLGWIHIHSINNFVDLDDKGYFIKKKVYSTNLVVNFTSQYKQPINMYPFFLDLINKRTSFDSATKESLLRAKKSKKFLVDFPQAFDMNQQIIAELRGKDPDSLYWRYEFRFEVENDYKNNEPLKKRLLSYYGDFYNELEYFYQPVALNDSIKVIQFTGDFPVSIKSPYSEYWPLYRDSTYFLSTYYFNKNHLENSFAKNLSLFERHKVIKKDTTPEIPFYKANKEILNSSFHRSGSGIFKKNSTNDSLLLKCDQFLEFNYQHKNTNFRTAFCNIHPDLNFPFVCKDYSDWAINIEKYPYDFTQESWSYLYLESPQSVYIQQRDHYKKDKLRSTETWFYSIKSKTWVLWISEFYTVKGDLFETIIHTECPFNDFMLAKLAQQCQSISLSLICKYYEGTYEVKQNLDNFNISFTRVYDKSCKDCEKKLALEFTETQITDHESYGEPSSFGVYKGFR